MENEAGKWGYNFEEIMKNDAVSPEPTRQSKHSQQTAGQKPGGAGRQYSPAGLYQLFASGAFPIHVWVLLTAFRDFAWVAERTETWDALGLSAYALVFALLESLALFAFVLLLGLALPRTWEAPRKTALLGSLSLTLAVWAVLGQAYYLPGQAAYAPLIQALARSAHPLRNLWAGVFGAVLLSTAVPALLSLRGKTASLLNGLFERLTVVSSLYLLLDLAGIVILVIRNVTL